MKAAQIETYGPAESIHVVEIERPAVADGQVLVRVRAASLNPFDSMVLSGQVAAMVPSLPLTLGGDIAGEVEAIGAGVDGLAPGDHVYGSAAAVAGGSGALAEYALTTPDQLAIMPTNLDFQQAAALPLVAVSAHQAVGEHLRLKAGQRLLVLGGAGGIGAIAIQLACHLGAKVAATASGDSNLAYVRALGAEPVIDYKTDDFSQQLHDYDAVLDTAGGDGFVKSYQVLKAGGTAVSLAAAVDAAAADRHGITAIHQMTQVNRPRLEAVSRLVASGVIKPRIGAAFPLDDAAAAFEARQSASFAGKIVIAIA